MKTLWDDDEARDFGDEPVQRRVFTARWLGREPALVSHGAATHA